MFLSLLPKTFHLATNGNPSNGIICDTILTQAGYDMGIHYLYKYKFNTDKDTIPFYGQTEVAEINKNHNINDTIQIVYYRSSPNLNAPKDWGELYGIPLFVFFIGTCFFIIARILQRRFWTAT